MLWRKIAFMASGIVLIFLPSLLSPLGYPLTMYPPLWIIGLILYILGSLDWYWFIMPGAPIQRALWIGEKLRELVLKAEVGPLTFTLGKYFVEIHDAQTGATLAAPPDMCLKELKQWLKKKKDEAVLSFPAESIWFRWKVLPPGGMREKLETRLFEIEVVSPRADYTWSGDGMFDLVRLESFVKSVPRAQRLLRELDKIRRAAKELIGALRILEEVDENLGNA